VDVVGFGSYIAREYNCATVGGNGNGNDDDEEEEDDGFGIVLMMIMTSVFLSFFLSTILLHGIDIIL
jgi:hypothetical protein